MDPATLGSWSSLSTRLFVIRVIRVTRGCGMFSG